MATGLTKAVIVLVCINIILFTSGLRVLPQSGYSNDNQQIMNKFVQDANGKWISTQEHKDTLPTSFGATLSGFIDGLGAVGNAIRFIIDIVFTPLALFYGMGLPSDAVLIIGLPLTIMLFLGMAYFFRSGF